MSFYEDKNTDDVFLRSVIVGLSGNLNERIEISHYSNGKYHTKKIKFFYSMAGDEQTLIDFYMKSGVACEEKVVVDGTTNILPMGIFRLTGATISGPDLTNRFERAIYLRKEKNEFGEEIKTLSARTDMVPILLNFDGRIKCTSELERFKVWQECVKTFYKNSKFSIHFDGFQRIPCSIGFPENFEMEKDFEFTYPADNKRPEVSFSFELMTYLPVIDKETIMHSGNRMSEGIGINLEVTQNPENK